ncbi:hypothetical protein LINPERPRIM_LOCUS27051 [Linum perenne]
MVVHSRAKVLVCVTMSLVLFVALSSEILMADQEVVHLSKYDDEHQKVKNEIDHRNHGEEEDLKQVKFRVHGSKSRRAPHLKPPTVKPPVVKPPLPPSPPPCSSPPPPPCSSPPPPLLPHK